MAQEVKNSVQVEGYLKENNLKLTKDDNGNEVIQGNIIVTVDEEGLNSVRIQVYANRYKKADEGKQVESKTFPRWLEILPEKTMTVVSYLKDNPEATFADAKQSVSRVYAKGSMEEYAVREDKKEISYATIKGISAGFKKDGGKNPFKPKAEFIISLFIEKMVEEVDDDGEETGRIIITGLTPNYDESVSRITYVTGTEEVAIFIRDNYEPGQTTYLTGDIVNIKKEVVKQQGEASFGRPIEDQIETKFENERTIFGGNPEPLSLEDEGAFTTKEIKTGLAKREEKIATNTEKRNNRENGGEITRGFNPPPKVTEKKAGKKFNF